MQKCIHRGCPHASYHVVYFGNKVAFNFKLIKVPRVAFKVVFIMPFIQQEPLIGVPLRMVPCKGFLKASLSCAVFVVEWIILPVGLQRKMWHTFIYNILMVRNKIITPIIRICGLLIYLLASVEKKVASNQGSWTEAFIITSPLCGSRLHNRCVLGTDFYDYKPECHVYWSNAIS